MYYTITIILAIVAIIQSIRSYRFSKKVAKKQGIFQKTDIKIEFYNQKNPPDYFIISCKIIDNRLLCFPFVINIKNNGDKSAENVKFALRINKRLCFGGKNIADMVFNGPKKYSYDAIEDQNYVTILIDFGNVNPGESVCIHYSMSIKEASIVNLITPATETKDKRSIQFNISISYLNFIDYSLFQRDANPIAGRVSFMIIDTSKDSLENNLGALSRMREKKYRGQLDTKLKRELYYIKATFAGMKTGKRFVLIRYDEKQTTRHKKLPIDYIPEEALGYNSGYEDFKGRIFFYKNNRNQSLRANKP